VNGLRNRIKGRFQRWPSIGRGGCPGYVRGKPLPEKATENCPPRVTFSIRASDSCRKLLTAEVWTIRACTAVLESCAVSFNGRDRPTDQRLVYGKSTPMLGSFLPFSFPGNWKVKSWKWKKRGEKRWKWLKWWKWWKWWRWWRWKVERTTLHYIQSVLNFSFYPPCRVEYCTCTDCVQCCIEFCWRRTGWMSIEHCWNYTKSFFSSFHLWCSVNDSHYGR